jgi:hypothetical protein
VSDTPDGNVAKFHAALKTHGMIPYRKGGRVRVACTPTATDAVKEAARRLVAKFAERLAEGWEEPTREETGKWFKAKLVTLDVGDEPCPPGVKLTEVGADWLAARAARYHFDLALTPDGHLDLVGHAGWTRDDRQGPKGVVSGFLSLTPQWYLKALEHRKAEVVEFLKAKGGAQCAPRTEGPS